MEQTLNIDQLLSIVSTNESISDLHLSSEETIALRVNGEIQRYEKVGKLTIETMEIVLRQLMKGDPKSFDKFMGDKDADFSYIGKDGTAYRVNAFIKLGKIGIVMRKINGKAKQLEELMFPELADSIKKNILTQQKGLFLVTGPTGSGKSTSLVAMLELINQTRHENIITIEDPIEFIFEPKNCIVNQREIGHDTRSYANALRATMREDPDIIFIGEIRDKETAEAALSLAESGHLVFSTLHTGSAASTVNRFIGFFSPEIQDSMADRLADALIGVQSQTLLKTKDNGSRLGLFELMINTTAIRNNIKKREIQMINSILSTSLSDGMITMEQYAKKLIAQGLIDKEQVAWLFISGDK